VWRSESGQATVETVALLPLLALVALACLQVLAAGAAGEAAQSAAEAGAVALFQGADAAGAAREALPASARPRARVEVLRRSVRVQLRPREVLPGAADLLVADARADAGRSP
jgi:hypothetical protein